MKIDFPTIIDIQKEVDPELHREVFMKMANDVVLRSIPKTNTKLKRKWNVIMKKQNTYNWVLASAIDGSFSKRGGHMNFKVANKSYPVINITMDGSPINDKRFDFSFDKEIASLASNKRKQGVAIRRKGRTSGKDIKRPRVKILKSKTATTLNKAFYATMPSGHSGIFRRKGGKIIELRTITLPSMFEQLDFDEILDRHYKENATKRYDHYLFQALKKR